MKKKLNLNHLLLCEGIFCFIFSFLGIPLLMFQFWKISRVVFTLLSIFWIVLSSAIIPVGMSDLMSLLFFNPSSIFNHGKWEYFETTKPGILKIKYISTSWKKQAIDLTNTNQSIEEICEFIKENNVYFEGWLEVKNSIFYIDNFKIDKNRVIQKLKKYELKNIRLKTTVNILFVRNTFADWKCISFIKIGETKTSLLNHAKKLNLNLILKKYLTCNENNINKTQLDFFDAIADYSVGNDNVLYLHKNQWVDFENSKEQNDDVKKEKPKYGKNSTIVIH